MSGCMSPLCVPCAGYFCLSKHDRKITDEDANYPADADDDYDDQLAGCWCFTPIQQVQTYHDELVSTHYPTK